MEIINYEFEKTIEILDEKEIKYQSLNGRDDFRNKVLKDKIDVSVVLDLECVDKEAMFINVLEDGNGLCDS